ncbi:DUF2062 domain-containing protein [Thiosulfativibrio zosterae]|uniref:DUF2062 domain-containing protein n=1 Tax=Thiosulfativibrio zosterae TaxID=2675053 RepID=A0A6F8PK26_9GAMM|nr:DUF2062 domain-containing protein [Thiosulfativibrio zosterae]BBP42449.1 hypothetical protein THMIRHAT_01950 [Thiosulfativibrio zosterae]
MGLILKLFKALNANQYPGQIALSFVLGMILGLTPLFFAHNLLTLALIFMLRVNLAGVVVAWAFFSGLAYLLDPIFNQLGLWVLQMPALEPMFTEAYNSAVWRFLHFNNSIVMGSILVSYLLAIPAFILFLILIKTYRKTFLAWVSKFKVVQMLKAADKASLVS